MFCLHACTHVASACTPGFYFTQALMTVGIFLQVFSPVVFHKQEVKPKMAEFYVQCQTSNAFFLRGRTGQVTSSEVRAERGLALDVKFRHFWLHFLYWRGLSPDHWQKCIWTACLAWESVIRNGRLNYESWARESATVPVLFTDLKTN